MFLCFCSNTVSENCCIYLKYWDIRALVVRLPSVHYPTHDENYTHSKEIF